MQQIIPNPNNKTFSPGELVPAALAAIDIKAVFFDIDGTLLYHDTMTVTEKSLLAIRQLHQNGIKVAICTGRSLSELGSVPKSILDCPFDGIITSAGGYATVNGAMVHGLAFSKATLKTILSVCGRYGIEHYFVDDMGGGMHAPASEHVIEAFAMYHGNIPAVRKMNPECVYHMMIYCDEAMDQMLQAELGELTYHRAGERSVDIYPYGVNKAMGMQILCDQWKIDLQETLAFGDSFNDIEMLQSAGIGVAMGNGSDAAKAVADIVCKRLEEDGIYHTCKQLGLL